RVLDHRQGQAGEIAAGGGIEAVQALGDAPAVVAPSETPRLEIDLLKGILADVADVEIAATAVEAEAERIAQPQVPDVGIASARVARRGRRVRIDVDAQDLSELGVKPLAVV